MGKRTLVAKLHFVRKARLPCLCMMWLGIIFQEARSWNFVWTLFQLFVMYILGVNHYINN